MGRLERLGSHRAEIVSRKVALGKGPVGEEKDNLRGPAASNLRGVILNFLEVGPKLGASRLARKAKPSHVRNRVPLTLL